MEDNNKLKPVNVDGNSCNELLHKSLRSANQMLYANLSEGFKNDEQEDPSTKTFTVEEVAKHNTEKDAWVIYNKKVYDITHYIKYHPGGEDILLEQAGKDITNYVFQYHPWVNVERILANTYIGNIDE
ncbi:hypothetical protein MKS88_001966 [Plasmodium brasilianum]|uniref:Uncharacterized protein n=2 Tax=Plasmodium (Plasmodium) TaxID=418103 RepID=A0ACB9YCI5_PLABR|nr:hypothetical protein MKS88_001966 [Plasmodium brasilianum]